MALSPYAEGRGLCSSRQ